MILLQTSNHLAEPSTSPPLYPLHPRHPDLGAQPFAHDAADDPREHNHSATIPSMPIPPQRKAEHLENDMPDVAVVCLHVFIIFLGTGLMVMVGWSIWRLVKGRTRKAKADGGKRKGTRAGQTVPKAEQGERQKGVRRSDRIGNSGGSGAVGVPMEVLRKKGQARRSRSSMEVCSTLPEVRVEEV